MSIPAGLASFLTVVEGNWDLNINRNEFIKNLRFTIQRREDQHKVIVAQRQSEFKMSSGDNWSDGNSYHRTDSSFMSHTLPLIYNTMCRKGVSLLQVHRNSLCSNSFFLIPLLTWCLSITACSCLFVTFCVVWRGTWIYKRIRKHFTKHLRTCIIQ